MTKRITDETIQQVHYLLESFEEEYFDDPHACEFLDAMAVIQKCIALLNQKDSS